MNKNRVKAVFHRAVSLVGVALVTGAFLAAQQPGPAQAPAPPPLSPDQLNNLVAPIALYPDSLLSQILVASTYPLEVAEAGQWLQRNPGLQGSQLVDAARQQNWDPSVQALVVFPDVVNRLNSDIRWTTDLGNAFLSQQADVMNAVQRMRVRAMAAGKLNSNSQQTVTTENEDGQQEVEIQPTNPEMVYVPSYDPAYVWGPPAWGYYPAWDYPAYGFGFGFGPGIYIGGFFGGLGWGGWGWGLNWHRCSIFERGAFFNHYGYRGYAGGAGFRGTAAWAHNPGHRLGVAYPNHALTARYGAVSNARGAYSARGGAYSTRGGAYSTRGGAYNARGTYSGRVGGNSVAPRTSSGGWSHFGSNGSTANGSRGYRSSPAYGGNRSYSASPSYRNSYSGRSTAPSYRSSPSYNTGRSYGASPSYRGYSGRSASPSYRSSPSYGGGNRGGGGGGFHASGGGSHASGGGGFHGGGGGGFHGGGSGGSHGGGHR